MTRALDSRVPPAGAAAQAAAQAVTQGFTYVEEHYEEDIGFWSAGELRPPYFVRPCRKRFDLYQLSATLPNQCWHKENVMAQADSTPETLPEPGRKKKSPRELDKLLDKGIEESMDASDPPAAAQPEVHTEADRDEVETDSKDGGKHKQ